MRRGKVVVPFRIAEPAQHPAALDVEQIHAAGKHVSETQREIAVPKIPGFEARERSRVSSVLRGGRTPLDPRPEELGLEPAEPTGRPLPIAAGLTADHAAAGVVVERAELGWKTFTLGLAGRDGLAEVVPVPAPAPSGMDTDVASGPVERRRECRGLEWHIGGVGRTGSGQCQHPDDSHEIFFHDVPLKPQRRSPPFIAACTRLRKITVSVKKTRRLTCVFGLRCGTEDTRWNSPLPLRRPDMSSTSKLTNQDRKST